jgi:hypothetical protein
MSSDRGDPRSTGGGAAHGSRRADVPDGTETPEEDEADGADDGDQGDAATDGDGVGDEEAVDGEAGEQAAAERPDETVPAVELGLYQLSVKVNGQSSDSIDDVEASARRLMDYLVETAEALEDNPDDRGLG